MNPRIRLTRRRASRTTPDLFVFADGSRQQFLKEHGDDLVKNPNPDGKDEIKIKSLPGGDEKAKGFFQRMFEKWKGDDEGDSGEKDTAKARKTLMKLKPSSEKDQLSFYQNLTRDNGTVKNKEDLQNFVKDHFEDAVEAWIKNPPSEKNAPKNPSLKDLAMHYNNRALIDGKKIKRIAHIERRRLTAGKRRFGQGV